MIGRRAPIIMVIGDLAQIGVEANDKKKKIRKIILCIIM